jgi:glycosyltransferase involved in cell wall biosynthesis
MISILICTYNRGNLIHETLQSLIEEQTIEADQIVVVNGGGERDCNETLDYWKAKCGYLEVINCKNLNLANSRNVGIRACKGDLVLMTDDDARAFPDWIQKMEEAHIQYPKAGVIGGEVLDALGKGLLGKVADVTTFPRYPAVTSVHSVPGVNCSYKKAVLNSIGEQDIRMFRGEDVDFNWRARKAGWDVLYVPEIKVLHFHRPTWKGLFHQHHMYGRAYLRVRRKWKDMYCLYPHELNSMRSLLKLLRYPFVPFMYATVKANEFKSYAKVSVFFILLCLSYYTLYGTIRQYFSDQWINKNA